MISCACVLFLVGMVSSGGVSVPAIRMNDGRSMPAIALGTFLGAGQNGLVKPDEKQVRDAVQIAIDLGYRHIDTAYIYQTEDQIGEAMKNKIEEGAVKREDMFITTKLWNTHHKKEEVALELRESLERLKLNYVDLYLMHWPIGLNSDHTLSNVDFMETWRGMEDVQKLGLAKSIGVSNFNKEQLERLLREGTVKPAALQIEVHPQIIQTELLEFCRSHDIVVMGYSPLGSLVSRFGIMFPGPRMDDPILVNLAKKYGKTPVQIVLRWSIERNVVPLPKSVNPKRLEENINIFDFKLTDEEIESINGYNSNVRLIAPSFWQESKYYPFDKVQSPLPDPFTKKL